MLDVRFQWHGFIEAVGWARFWRPLAKVSSLAVDLNRQLVSSMLSIASLRRGRCERNSVRLLLSPSALTAALAAAPLLLAQLADALRPAAAAVAVALAATTTVAAPPAKAKRSDSMQRKRPLARAARPSAHALRRRRATRSQRRRVAHGRSAPL